ncbi:MAG: hemin-degrading factor [Planctomycetes bacterium]|nr:hemin-degrading factor [Planctomycetota bacterium]
MPTQTAPIADPDTLAAQWTDLLEAEPKLRIRDAAERLGVSEANLLELSLEKGVTRLTGSLTDLFARVGELGRCMALTRNQAAVHERTGEYEEISFGGHGGLVLGPDIDLRLFPKKWATAYAVIDEDAKPTRRSLQFFDKNGIAAHKIYLRDEEKAEAFTSLVSDFSEGDAAGLTYFEAPEAPKEEKPDQEIDVAGFQEAWLGMKDTHDFFMICHKYGVSRTQALRLAPEDHALEVSNDSFRRALEGARDGEFPIMVFVSSPGVIQIHTGPVKKLMEYGDWYNVMDPDFNLHVRETAIASTWIVRKPTKDGIVTSLELFDDKGENILLMFGARKPGKPELTEWLELTEALIG